MRLTFLQTAAFAAVLSTVAATGGLTWDTQPGDGATITTGSGTWSLSTTTWNNGADTGAWTNGSDARFAPGAGEVPRITIGTDALQANSVTVGGAGTTVFQGNRANLSTPQLDVEATGAGKLAILSASSADGAIEQTTVAPGASLYLSATALRTAITVSGQGNTERRGALRIDDNSTLSGSVSLGGATTIGVSRGSGTVSGPISGPFRVSRAAVGDGTLLLTGQNSFSGGFTSTRATVRAGNDDAFGSGSLTIRGTLTSIGSAPRSFANPLSISGRVVFGDAANAGALGFSGAATIPVGAALTTNAPVHLERATLGGDMTHAGAATLSFGRLEAGALAELGGAALFVPVTGTTIDTADHTVTLSAPLTGSGTVTKTGTGTLRVNASSTFSGEIDVQAGAVEFVGSGQQLPAGLQIYPSGDSIAYGGSAPAGYRSPLMSMLASSAPDFRFVGDSQEAPGSLPVEQRSHGGHASYSTWDIERNLDGLSTETFAQYGASERDPHGGHWLTGLSEPLTYTVPNRGTTDRAGLRRPAREHRRDCSYLYPDEGHRHSPGPVSPDQENFSQNIPGTEPDPDPAQNRTPRDSSPGTRPGALKAVPC